MHLGSQKPHDCLSNLRTQKHTRTHFKFTSFLMAPSLSYTPTIPLPKPQSPLLQFRSLNARNRSFVKVTRCESQNPSTSSNTGLPAKNSSAKLEIGSPIIVIETPKTIKTAASVPCLRVNAGLVKAGDVGRIVSRKPKDVWAVRLSIGTYLIDGKHFKPMSLINE